MDQSSDAVAAGVEILIREARRLGLMWRIIPATVTLESTTPTNTAVLFDGDTQPARAQSLIGLLPVNRRVMVLVIPPQGNYIIGFNGPTLFESLVASNVRDFIGTDATVGAGFGQLGTTNLEVPFIKRFAATRVRVDMQMGCFSTVTNTSVEAGLQFIGGANPVVTTCFFFFNVANAHASFNAHVFMLNLPVGTYTCRPVWRRVAGTGTLTTDSNDLCSYTAHEEW